MGCCFACFRTKEENFISQAHLVTEPVKSIKIIEAGESISINHDSGSLQELKDEVKFLKTCGTILKTPPEIQKASENMKGSPPNNGVSEFYSWFPTLPFKTLQLDNQLDQLSDYSKDTPISCVSISSNTGTMSIKANSNQSNSTATPVSAPTNFQRTNKSVRFDGVFRSSSSSTSSGSASQIRKNLESSCNNNGMPKHSPYATPLVLTDEMQTPGTFFPSDYTQNKKNARIRSQYVYLTVNPIGDYVKWDELKEEDDNIVKSLDKPVNELKVDSTLEAISKKTPGDRPILGTVAAYYGDDGPCISQKIWDGNGIPNSTNKYKEDQKVSWHATPFEERLVKALSEESSVCQRMDFNKAPITFEDEESDTGASHFKYMNHSESVNSC